MRPAWMKQVWMKALAEASFSPLPGDVTEEEIKGRNVLSIGIHRQRLYRSHFWWAFPSGSPKNLSSYFYSI